MENDFLKNRHSYRNFSKQTVSDQLLEEIIEDAMRAPTCGNMQLYSVIVTRDADMKEKMAPMHFNQPAAKNANVILTICADFQRFSKWCELSDAVPGYDNFHSFITALTDGVIFAQQITTVAESKGLGTCYMGTVNYNATAISELLELPELVVPVACIALGYPEGEPEIVERLPLKAVMHKEKYEKFSNQEIIDLFKVKDEFPLNVHHKEINGKSSLAQVYTDIRYPKEMNEQVSKTFLNLIVDKGFKV
ncbi:MAG: nitroreductase family protein [Muribaculaceae bacterium]|nr:nitroreductase family protein [Muribaculaceae bacterium]